MQLRAEYTLGEDWMIGLFALVLAIVAFVKFRHSKKLNKLFDAFQNPRMVRQLMREEQVFANSASVLLDVNFWLMLSLFMFFLLKRFSELLYDSFGIHLMWMLMLGILAIYLVKFISGLVMGSLFDKSYGIGEYLYNVYIFNKALGLVLIPVNMALALFPLRYSVLFLVVAIVIIALLLTFRTIRGLRIGKDNNAKDLYLFLYLCALEFLPLALIVKELRTLII
ncbi:MAG: DUF4271 domain-containing protein [Flavobacteriales bacterium]|nr:DUF4271 domain-containing protein [Flavobacteriales bacterium]